MPDAPDAPLSTRHLVALVGGALCIAFAPIFAVQAGRLGGIGMWDAAFWRVGIATLVMAPVVWRLDPGFGFRNGAGRAHPGWWCLPGLLFAGDIWAWHWSFEHTSVANATLLANVSILFVTLFAWLVWKERITLKFALGASVAFGGVVLLILSSQGRSGIGADASAAGNPVLGDALALLTACFYAAYQLTMKRYRRERSAPLLLFWASAVSAIVLLPLAWFHEDPFFPQSGIGWWPLIGIGIVSHACGQELIAYSLGGLPASLASVVLLVQPVGTAVLGVFLLGQALVPWQIAGGIAVVTGLFVAIRGQRAPRGG